MELHISPELQANKFKENQYSYLLTELVIIVYLCVRVLGGL